MALRLLVVSKITQRPGHDDRQHLMNGSYSRGVRAQAAGKTPQLKHPRDVRDLDARPAIGWMVWWSVQAEYLPRTGIHRESPGGENVFRDAPSPYPSVSLEEVLARNPEVIVDMGDMADTVNVTAASARSGRPVAAHGVHSRP